MPRDCPKCNDNVRGPSIVEIDGKRYLKLAGHKNGRLRPLPPLPTQKPAVDLDEQLPEEVEDKPDFVEFFDDLPDSHVE